MPESLPTVLSDKIRSVNRGPASSIMLRRASLSLVPTLLALAFLCGTPATSVGGPETSAASWSTGTASPVVRGNLTQDVPDIVANQFADEDDTPQAQIVRVVTTLEWPTPAHDAPIGGSDGVVGPTHRPCAAPPRAPPTA